MRDPHWSAAQTAEVDSTRWGARAWWALTARILSTLSILCWTGCQRTTRSEGLTQEAYVWQRQWNSNVATAVLGPGTHFNSLVPLTVQVDWNGGQPSVVRVPVDYEVLARRGRPVGLAIRVGPYLGPFSTNDAAVSLLCAESRESLRLARTAGLRPSEMQVDFDCAERHLDGYRQWLLALKAALDPVPVVMTALPSWLKQPAFAALARTSDGFVLQVHSLSRPKSAREVDPLCDPDLARRAVDRAARFGVPFRVALPTYGYRLAFGPKGEFLSASAEGMPPRGPIGTTVIELSADPVSMAGLVAAWRNARPESLRGILWYRLPVPGDQLNWRWATLHSVMSGRSPASRLSAAMARPQPGLVEITVINEGDADLTGEVNVRARWDQARLVAADGIHGFTVGARARKSATLENPLCRLPAGETLSIGWVRLDADVPVLLDLHRATDSVP